MKLGLQSRRLPNIASLTSPLVGPKLSNTYQAIYMLEPPTQDRKVTFRRQLLQLGVCGLAVYLCFLAILYSPLYQAIILRPDIASTAEYKQQKIDDVEAKDIYFRSQGNKLHGWLFEKPNAKTIVIVHHGNAGNIIHRLHIAKAALDSNSSVLLYDYAGYGQSSGTASLNGILSNGLDAFDFVRSNFKYEHILNYGESIGSAVASNVNDKRSADGLILQSGIASLPTLARDGMSFLNLYPDLIWPHPQFNNCLLLTKSKTPLLLMHGQLDKLVPYHDSEYLFKSATAGDKLLVKLPNCGHNDVGYYDADIYQKAMSEFIAKYQ